MMLPAKALLLNKLLNKPLWAAAFTATVHPAVVARQNP